MSLQNVQHDLLEAILAEQPAHNITPQANLLIYRNNFFITLTKALRQVYPLINKLLGEDFFTQRAHEYITLYPSRQGNLLEYGEYFSRFLLEHPLLQTYIYLPEVAQFEWACHLLLDAAEHAPLDKQALAAISSDQYSQLHITLHPASCVMQFVYPLLQMIDLCNGKRDAEIQLEDGGVNLLMVRRLDIIKLIELTQSEYIFLEMASLGASLEEAYLAAIKEDSPFDLETALFKWVAEGIIVEFYF